MFVNMAGAYQRGVPFRHFNKLLALPANIRLGWNSLLSTKTSAYSGHQQKTSVKSFIKLAAAKTGKGMKDAGRRAGGMESGLSSAATATGSRASGRSARKRDQVC